jgi:DNA mismatch repair protein MutL
VSDIINLLPDSLANQIAAGEVVQRPSSAVKELMENSVDAGAKKIQVIVKDAGKSLIRIIDDGQGMSETDARMSFERHATSKIHSAEDLFAIATMGFRGEALASIGAVAQVEMKTRLGKSELGSCLIVEGSEVKSQIADGCPIGTSISVKNLFYNVPARRNFLKSNSVEMKHIVDEFQRVALAHPEIEFSLFHDDLEIYQLPAGKLSQRIVDVFGKSYREQLAACEEETTHINIKGYIGKPEFAKRTRGEQFFFVNDRFIKNPYLNHAVLNAFEGLIPEGSFPFYILFISIDPASIDVNVHPTKNEIKFEDERTVYGIVRAAVRQALASHNLAPSLDFEQDVNFLSRKMGASSEKQSIADRAYYQFKNVKKAGGEDWEKLFEGISDRLNVEGRKDKPDLELTFESSLNQELPAGEQTPDTSVSPFQLHNRYIIKQVKSGMMIFDQERVHQRILFEKFNQNLENKSGNTQQCLFPQTVHLNISDYSLVMDMSEEIRSLGFEFEVMGKDSLVINGIPSDLSGGNEKEIFEGLLEQFKENKTELSLPTKENLAMAMAKQSSIKHGKSLSKHEMDSLIDKLFGCSNPNYTPDGQPVYIIFDLEKIIGLFKRN